MLPVILLAAGVTLLAVGCAGEGELPPRSNIDDDEDAGKDAANEADAPADAKDAGQDADAEAAVDAEAGVDAPVDSPDDAVEADVPGDADADAPGDAPEDAYVDGEASIPAKYACTLIATNKNGAKYAMWMGSDADVATSPSGFDAFMHFVAAAGTPSTIVDERVSGKAATWPKDGQVLEQAFANLSGLYELIVSPTGGNHSLAIRTFDIALNQYVNKTLLPMTYADANGNPVPVEPDTANEIYLGFSPHLVIDVACAAANCASLQGTKDVSAATGDEYKEISISCDQQ